MADFLLSENLGTVVLWAFPVILVIAAVFIIIYRDAKAYRIEKTSAEEYRRIELAHRKAEEEVNKNSKRLQYIKEIAEGTNEHASDLEKHYRYDISFKSKTQFENCDELKAAKNYIAEHKEEIVAVLKKCALNLEISRKYERLLEKAPPLETENPDERYRWTEERLVMEYERKIKPTIPDFVFSFSYVSSQGRVHYEHTRTLDFYEMIAIYKQIQSDEKHKTSAQYERSQMTQTLRYDVMKRDHFRCVLCGRSADDGVKLHVDHIVPVAKGGKTVMSNLRTLCEDCNRGKRDKYDENGEN